MYGAWYQGVAPQQAEGRIRAALKQPFLGCWSTDSQPLGDRGTVRPELVTLEDRDKATVRKMAVGYNFSGLSPLHCSFVGSTKLSYTKNGHGQLELAWSDAVCANTTVAYHASTVTSVWRIGTAMGLLMTNDIGLRFDSTTTMTTWIHMALVLQPEK